MLSVADYDAVGDAKRHDHKVVEGAKQRARSDLALADWVKQGWAFVPAALAEPPPLGVIARETAAALSTAEFVARYERPNLPVVIDGVAAAWPALAADAWRPAALYARYRHRRFKCGEDDRGYPVRVKLKYFLRYAAAQRDDSPLYVFDSMYQSDGSACGILHDYAVPRYFGEGALWCAPELAAGCGGSLGAAPACVVRALCTASIAWCVLRIPVAIADLFKLVGDHRRPPYRWFLVGPKRSGTTVHIDPLSTSAWNTLVYGRKR